MRDCVLQGFGQFPFPSPLFFFQFYPYWLGNSKCLVIPFWLACSHCKRGGLWPYLSSGSDVLWYTYFWSGLLFVKFLKETWGGVSGVCYILKRNLTPQGVGLRSEAPSSVPKCVFFPTQGPSSPSLSLSAYWILSFPIIISANKGHIMAGPTLANPVRSFDGRKLFSIT